MPRVRKRRSEGVPTTKGSGLKLSDLTPRVVRLLGPEATTDEERREADQIKQNKWRANNRARLNAYERRRRAAHQSKAGASAIHGDEG